MFKQLTLLVLLWTPCCMGFERSQPLTGCDVPTQIGYVKEKPLIIEIEKAAGQDRTTVSPPTGTICEAVQGVPGKLKSECCAYGSELQDPALREYMAKLTKPRIYPLFLMEKTAKTVTGMFPGKSASAPTQQKEKLVILGTGWGAAALLSEIDNDQYDVTVVSPRNYFLFTPMLPGASVGTVDIRSITQPIREVRTTSKPL